MRKKLFTFLLALTASVGMMWAQGPWTSGDCTLTLSGGVMTVSGSGAMADYNKSNPWKSYNSSITSIVIEDGVTHVGNGTFPQCTSLVSVVIGDDVETIGEFTFDDAGASLTSVTMGNKVKSIGMAAFLWDTGLPELILSEDLETIGDYAFCRMEALTTITIPSKVTSIGAAAFSNCSALQSIYIEAATPPTLGDGVFANVNADLSTIPLYVPNGSVAAYTAAAQWNAFNIQGYDPAPTPANVCGDGLTWELSEGVLTISYDGEGTGEMYDFGYEYDENPVNVAPWKENKSAITTVIVGDGVKSIGNYAFNDLYENFTAVTIANSVERIGLSAFMNAKWITEITLPSSLKTIDRECFAANFGFTSITIPSGVTSIGYHAFGYCTALTSLTCEATTPPTLASGVFYKITSKTSDMSNIPLYVPSESVAAYQDANQWNAFNVQAIPGGGSTDVIPCTAADLGKVLCTDGSIYATVSEATAASKTVAAVIAYVDTENGKALALALANESGTMDWETAKTTAAAHTPAVSGGTWTLASKDDWDHMINAAGGYNALRDGFSAVGGTNIQKGQYWTSTEYDSGTSLVLNFGTNDGGYFVGLNEDPCNVRACLAFDIPAAPAPTDEQVVTNEDPENPSYHYSTFFHSTQNYKLTNDGTVAFIADLSGNDLVLTKIAEGTQVIPANTAVILRKSGSADPVVLTPTEENGVSFSANNDLLGVDAETAAPENCYVLSGTDQYGVGFYQILGNTLKAHKAYVIYTGNAAPKRMRFVFNTTTDVEAVTGYGLPVTEKRIENGQLIIIKNGVRYNAQGQVVK